MCLQEREARPVLCSIDGLAGMGWDGVGLFVRTLSYRDTRVYGGGGLREGRAVPLRLMNEARQFG